MTNISDELLRCPLTLVIFCDPVVAEDGHTYERQAIEEWIRNHGTSPITQEPLSIKSLISNHRVKQIVDAFESSMNAKDHKFLLNVDVKRCKGQPLFQAFGKTIHRAKWLPHKNNRPEIVLLQIGGVRAKAEASFYANLTRHPHIVRTFGFVYDQDMNSQQASVLLLQEYASQGSLYDFLQDRRMPPDEKILIQIFLQITEAMIYLASNHVVHGDLACRNVLVFRFDENQPEKSVVKITDFGLSRHSRLDERTTSNVQLMSDTVPVRYAAPEVLSSNATSKVYTEKSDVYSMGVLMWEAYSQGSLPWMDIERDDEIIRRVTAGEILPQPPNCSHPFWSIVVKSWHRIPNDRPTFSELKHLLAEQYYRPDQPGENMVRSTPTGSVTAATCGSKELVSCSFCNEQFRSSRALGEHLILCGNKTNQCPVCQGFVRRAIFAFHCEYDCADPETPSSPPSYVSAQPDCSSKANRIFQFPRQSKSHGNNTTGDTASTIRSSKPKQIQNSFRSAKPVSTLSLNDVSVQVQTKELKTSMGDRARESKSSANDETFAHCVGDVCIEDSGYAVLHGPSLNSAEVRGKKEYASGEHQLRLKIEKNPSRIAIIIGIISKSTPVRDSSHQSSTFYGWASFGGDYRGGLLRKSDGIFSIYDNNENDTVALIINTDKRTIQYTNERTKDTQHMQVDVNRCPLPWQLHVTLGGDDDQLRLLSYSELRSTH